MAEMFGPYAVVALVGQGSTGRVFRARHVELGRDAAVKELAEAVRGAPGVSERLRAEAERLAGLSHPNIVALYDYVEEPGRSWLAEQWVDGATLERILAVHGRLSPEQALGAVRGAVLGLAHAHERGLVHRDVSAGNILADLAGTSMLVDFGLAGPAGAGAALGTPAFLSPEAARGEAVGKAADVYSVAAVLFLLLSGQVPFPGSAVESVRGHLEGPVPRLSGHGADLEDLLARSMSKDPGQRPPDAAAFLAELEEAATRRYGAGWLQRASIAGLVGSAMAGGLAGAGGGAAGGAAQTVVFDAATRAAVGGPGGSVQGGLTKPARSMGSKVAFAVAAAVVVGVVGTTAVVALGNGDPKDSSANITDPDGDAKDADASPTPTVDPVVDTVPSGRWNYRSVVIRSSDPEWAKVGTKDTAAWRLRADCASASACGGVVKSSSGVTRTTAGAGPCCASFARRPTGTAAASTSTRVRRCRAGRSSIATSAAWPGCAWSRAPRRTPADCRGGW